MLKSEQCGNKGFIRTHGKVAMTILPYGFISKRGNNACKCCGEDPTSRAMKGIAEMIYLLRCWNCSTIPRRQSLSMYTNVQIR